MKKYLFGLLLAMFLAVGLLPTVALAETVSNVQYRNYDAENGTWIETATCPSATVVTDTDLTWGDDGNDGWYVVNSNVTMPSRVVVNGNVHLILANGCTLTVNGGIQVEDDDASIFNGSTNALTIYAQSTGDNMGKLIAQNAAYGCAAIGGGRGERADSAGGTITINGGNVSATSVNPSAAIGGGGTDGGSAGGNITINGGIVTATSRGLGAGIGGNGGPVNAGSGGIITITGGIVRAESNESTGIGGGTKHPSTLGNSGKITITGGTITAITNSTRNAPGIGGNGLKDSNNSITIVNGKAVVFATSISNKANQDSWSGIIFEGNEGKVYGSSVTPVADFTIDSGKNLCIPEGSVLNISGISATNEGGIYVAGTLSGSPLGGNLYYPLVLTSDIASDKAYSYGGKTYGKAGETITLTGTDIPVGHKAIWNATPTVTFAGDSWNTPLVYLVWLQLLSTRASFPNWLTTSSRRTMEKRSSSERRTRPN